jgi:hypothetical protein
MKKTITRSFITYTLHQYGKIRNEHKILIGKLTGRPRHRWEDNIKMGFKEIGCEGVNWSHLAQDSVQWRIVVNMVMNLRVP